MTSNLIAFELSVIRAGLGYYWDIDTEKFTCTFLMPSYSDHKWRAEFCFYANCVGGLNAKLEYCVRPSIGPVCGECYKFRYPKK